MNLFREVEHKKLTELTVLSNKVLKDLKKKVNTAEKIVKLAEMNRKLETEEEKVLPFYKSNISEEVEEEVMMTLKKKVESGVLHLSL
jgi:hemerythrin-like domain-containing protein